MDLTMKRTFVFTCLLLGSIALAAQTPTRLRVDVRLVNIVATVTDENGRFVPNLTADDFTILEDGVPQKISHFTRDRDIPVSVGILLDTSGSMSEKMRAATEAVDRFINEIHAGDDIFLMTFAGKIALQQDFTSDRKKLARALNSLGVGGGTLLFDALRQGIEKVQTGRHDKRAVLVISDGMDQGSKSSLETLLRSIRGAEVLVYGLGAAPALYADPTEHVPFVLPTPSAAARGPGRPGTTRRSVNSSVNMNVLNQFATNSGGQSFLLSRTFIDDDEDGIDKVFATIAEELREQYTIGYYPSAPDNGQFHTIKVTTSNGYNVRTRTGYQGRQ